ncbi:hypothetical protein [Reichenbachiella ulvae]|uniref:SMODS and SLOG-associating 2TM effector domain-containing protein n=1 Tax=Reichenbachiella ulvae TaxID=2980104 RepID=A0ABT3D145_9BACT|nr:hypothetical protein [Reichenbachiella ulvae]MCV9389543.1 hypothetical protein [Reichenbachiella ulvae]
MGTNHAYAPDIDLFGSNSLFQLLVRSKLSGTRALIKNWLLHRSTKNEIEERHAAIQELSTDTEWRQNLTAYGYHGDRKNEKYANVVVSLIQWIDLKLSQIDKPFWNIMRFIMPAAALTILAGINILGWPYQWIYLPILINLALLSILFKPLMDLTNEFGNIADFLKGYEHVIIEIEKKSFESPLLTRLHDQLKTKGQSASSRYHAPSQDFDVFAQQSQYPVFAFQCTFFARCQLATPSGPMEKEKHPSCAKLVRCGASNRRLV